MTSNSTRGNVTVTSQSSKRPIKFYDFLGKLQGDLSVTSGVTGVCYVVLKAVQVVPTLVKDKELMDGLECTIRYLLDRVEKDSRVPASLAVGSQLWITIFGGSPGFIPLFCEAAFIFSSNAT